MNSPTLKNTVPDPGRSGSGKDALGSAQQRLTTKLYTSQPKNSIPQPDNSLDDLIEKEYWMRRATDCLYRAWVHHRQGDLIAVDADLQDFFYSNEQQREDTDDKSNN